MRRFKIAFFNAVLLMCITYLSRDSCRNLICKLLGLNLNGALCIKGKWRMSVGKVFSNMSCHRGQEMPSDPANENK